MGLVSNVFQRSDPDERKFARRPQTLGAPFLQETRATERSLVKCATLQSLTVLFPQTPVYRLKRRPQIMITREPSWSQVDRQIAEMSNCDMNPILIEKNRPSSGRHGGPRVTSRQRTHHDDRVFRLRLWSSRAPPTFESCISISGGRIRFIG